MLVRRVVYDPGDRPMAAPEWVREDGWLAAENPHHLVHMLDELGVRSRRKLRLAAVGCLRAILDQLDRDSRRVVELAERYTDGLTAYADLRSTQEPAREAWLKLDRAHRGAAWGTPQMWAVRAAAQAAAMAGREAWRAAWDVASEHQGPTPT
jgi:hypothetical protein